MSLTTSLATALCVSSKVKACALVVALAAPCVAMSRPPKLKLHLDAASAE